MKDKQSKCEGTYRIVKNKSVNGQPYWTQQNGIHAIWFYMLQDGRKYWFLGLEAYLGSNIAYIAATISSFAWPTQIINGFYYFDGTGYSTVSPSNDVFFKDCKYF